MTNMIDLDDLCKGCGKAGTGVCIGCLREGIRMLLSDEWVSDNFEEEGRMDNMMKYSDEQVEYHREHWDPQGVHLSRSETIERMEAAGIESE